MSIRVRAARRAAAAAAGCAVVLAPAVALAATGSPARHAAAAGAPAAAARPAAPLCQTPGLVIWLNTNGSGAAGSVFYHLEITNLSGRACTLNGFPFLYAVSLAGRQVGRRASFIGHPRLVLVRNGKTVHVLLQIVDVLNFSRSLCRPVTAAGLKVYPPNQTRAKTVPFPFGACSSRRPTFLSVGPVQRGA